MSESSKSHASSPFSYIKTNRLVLRPPHLEDAPDVLVIHGNPETNRHNPAGPMKDLVAAKERITEWIRDWDNHGIGYWCVMELDGAQVIGVSGVRVMEWSGRQVLNLYYRYGPNAWGKGYATEVASAAVKIANQHLPELPVIAQTRPANHSSIPRQDLALGALAFQHPLGRLEGAGASTQLDEDVGFAEEAFGRVSL